LTKTQLQEQILQLRRLYKRPILLFKAQAIIRRLELERNKNMQRKPKWCDVWTFFWAGI